MGEENMKKNKQCVLSMSTTFLLLFAFVAIVFTGGPVQPPVVTDTLFVGRDGWGPSHADPVRANDEKSQELIFNTYDRLITFGAEVESLGQPGITHEKFWEFLPSLATNVPNATEIDATFTQTSFVWTICVRNEEPYPFPIEEPICTWWEDAFVELQPTQPFNSYHITDWIDNGDGFLSPSDHIFMNDYRWAPTIPEEIYVKDCRWWHVVDVQDHGGGSIYLVLEYEASLDFDPANPECTWFESQILGMVYHINGWVDNNPGGLISEGDILYIEEFGIIPVEWEKIGSGWTLIPITKRTWHILNVYLDPPVTLDLHRFFYDFEIRTDPTINFVDETGAVVDVFDIHDAEYSFKRGLVQDQYASPMWKFYKPFFDQMNSDYWDTGNPADAIELAWLIEDTVEILSADPPILRINVGIPFKDESFKQILCGTWASIVSREFSTSIGCWDGNLFLDENHDCIPDWFQAVRHSSSPYDGPFALRYVGTGPYYVSLWAPVTDLVILRQNTLYWQGWPAPSPSWYGCLGYLTTIDIEYISNWDVRREMFTACQLDICDVPRCFMMQLLDPIDPDYMKTIDPAIVTIKNLPFLGLDAVAFEFTINPLSPYIYTGKFPDGIPTDFFSNLHVRRAFAYSWDHSRWLENFWYNEALCRETPDIWGLVPDYYTYSPDPPWTYDINYSLAAQELQSAFFDDISVWESGFRLGIVYPAGDETARVACQSIRDFFTILSDYNRPIEWPDFIIDVHEIGNCPEYLNQMENRELPIFVTHSKGEHFNADCFKRTFMHSQGELGQIQNYTSATLGPRTGLTKDVLIDLAVKTPDGPARANMYGDLDDIYVMDCPSFPIAQPFERKWLKYWVKGWYYNALYPSDYYYHLWKQNTCWYDISGPVRGIPDGVCNIRDINFLIQCFNAKRPWPYHQDPKWIHGTYGAACPDPYGDATCNIRDVNGAVRHFLHQNQP
jgi:peptide/nickel transport system substrate-binding protein